MVVRRGGVTAMNGMCECYACHRRVPTPQAHRVSIDRETGHSSGGFRFGLRGASFYTGRTYYAKQDVWVCHDCYLAKRNVNRRAVAVGVLLAGVVLVVQISQAGRTERDIQQSQATNQASAAPKETISVQNRLIELGYLAGTADGAWGPRSRTALRAFKVANGLAAEVGRVREQATVLSGSR
jgi:Putative peptidoglycan binding domain